MCSSDLLAWTGIEKVNMKRLFTFGCSYTSFNWSTWADILGNSAEEFQNWGMTGGGNQFIFNSVHECNQRNKFQTGDTVIVCWSGTTRMDWYKSGRWSSMGNVYTQPLFDRNLIDLCADERGFLLRDIVFVEAVRRLLQQSNATWYFLSMVDFDTGTNKDVVNLYSDTLDCIRPSFETVLKDRKPIQIDLHPTPMEHLTYLDKVLPEIPVSEHTRLKVAQEDSTIRSAGYKLPPYRLPDIKRL